MKAKAVLIAAAALMCLTACGNSDSSQGAEGIVTLQTTAAEASTASTTTAADSSSAETTTATTAEPAKETKETKETTKKTTAEKKTTPTETQTEAPVSQTTTTTTTQATQAPVVTTPEQTTPAPEPTGPDLSTLRGRAMVTYKGFTFGVGENINDIKGKLGKESAPMQEAPNCLTGEKSPIYFYAGMEIETTYSGKIFSIRMGTTVQYQGDDVETAGGAKIGDGEGALTAALGNPTSQDEYGTKEYKEGSLTVTVFVFDGIIDTIQVTDSSING